MNGFELREEAFSLIARAFVQRGLRLVNGSELAFDWDRTVNDIIFQVRISSIDPSFNELPIAQLKAIPQGLPPTLPHILGTNHNLCYLDKTGLYFDPFEPEDCANHILDAIEQTLLILANGDSRQRDYGLEFGVYWKPISIGYLATRDRVSKGTVLTTSRIDGRQQEEVIIYSNERVFEQWCRNREQVKRLGTHPAIVIDLEEPPNVVLESSWPPHSWSNFLDWLYECHPSSEHQLLESAAEVLQKEHSFFAIICSQASGPFGVHVSFAGSIKKIVSRYRKKPGKKKTSMSLKHLRPVMKNSTHVREYQRLHIEDVTDSFITTRNQKGESLEGTPAAIVGCGTVGAHLANLLAKIGAGSGEGGQLLLFDDDFLKPSNLGRHLLGVKYLNENKAEAVADYLKRNAAHPRNIICHPHLETHQITKLFDNVGLIVDATGDEQFSTLLAYLASKARALGKSVTVLHVWVDANGLAARALLDDGTEGCYRCLRIYQDSNDGGSLIERFPLFSDGNHVPEMARIHYQCGESYIPFAEGVSVVAAGMAQQMALEYVQGSPNPRFRHISMHSSVKLTKSQNLTKYQKCPCCNPS